MLDALLFGIATQTNSGVPTKYAEQQLLQSQRCRACPPLHRPLSEIELGSGGEIYRRGTFEWSRSNPLVIVLLPDIEAAIRYAHQTEAVSISEGTVVEDVPHMLAFVKAVFLLNMGELAGILKTTRPTIYTWARGDVALHSRNAERLNHIYGLAKAVSERTNDTSNINRRDRDKSSSLVKLLSEDTVKAESVLKTIDANVHHISTANLRRAARKAFALKHNLQLPSREESQEKVDVLTGKRGSNQT